MPELLKAVKHLIEYAGVRVLALGANKLSISQARWLGRVLGEFTFNVIRIRREVTLANLSMAFPQKSTEQIVEIAKSTYQHFGMMLMETLKLLSMDAQEVKRLLQVENPAPFDQAQSAGKGAILITGHFGNWEYYGAWISASGYPATYMFQEQANPYVSKFIRRFRERMGMEVVPRGMALRSYLKALKQGRFVAALVDQDAGKNGIFVEFMGRQASTPTGPARFALKTGAPMLFGVAWRNEDNNLQAYAEPIRVDYKGLEAEAAVRLIVETYTRMLEKWIRKYPHQWFWMHKRWKTRPGNENKLK
ncbi:MAG: hypothetical protein D6814_05140 [Calditrichaeota bacterium]|nr:MAG: hypothetical protein D6814_05140 [Calditrichota bacterium]